MVKTTSRRTKWAGFGVPMFFLTHNKSEKKKIPSGYWGSLSFVGTTKSRKNVLVERGRGGDAPRAIGLLKITPKSIRVMVSKHGSGNSGGARRKKKKESIRQVEGEAYIEFSSPSRGGGEIIRGNKTGRPKPEHQIILDCAEGGGKGFSRGDSDEEKHLQDFVRSRSIFS